MEINVKREVFDDYIKEEVPENYIKEEFPDDCMKEKLSENYITKELSDEPLPNEELLMFEEYTLDEMDIKEEFLLDQSLIDVPRSTINRDQDKEKEKINFQKIQNSYYPIVLLRKLKRKDGSSGWTVSLTSRQNIPMVPLREDNYSSCEEVTSVDCKSLVASNQRMNISNLNAIHSSTVKASFPSNEVFGVKKRRAYSPLAQLVGCTELNSGSFVRGTFKCNDCSYTTKKKFLIQRHCVTHSEEKPYKCHKCSYAAKRKHDLRDHLRIHSGAKPFKCEFCSYAAVRSSALHKHLNLHIDEEAVNKKAKLQAQLLAQSSEINGNNEKILPVTEEFTDIDENPCDNIEKPFKCNHCSYAAADKSTLRNHVVVHFDDKPYKCDKCSYATYRKSTLSRHILTHSNVKAFKCDECPYSTVRKYILNDHVLGHIKSYRYKCRECSFTTKLRRSLSFHMPVHCK